MRLVVGHQTRLDLDADADACPGATLVWPKVAWPPLVNFFVSQGVVLLGGPAKQVAS